MDLAEYWDQRAREDAVYFSDPRQAYGAPDLERLWADGEEDLARLLGELGVAVEPGAAVLDLGCGVGRVTRALVARGARVVALDVSAAMLARARELSPDLPGVRWVHAASLAGLDADGLDAAVSLATLQHQPDQALTLRYVAELGRVLRPGGWAALEISNDPAVHRAGPSRGERLRARLGRAPRGLEDRRWMGSAVPLEALHATALSAGLDIERIVRPGEQHCSVLLTRGAPT